jgi:hypothetical protein
LIVFCAENYPYIPASCRVAKGRGSGVRAAPIFAVLTVLVRRTVQQTPHGGGGAMVAPQGSSVKAQAAGLEVPPMGEDMEQPDASRHSYAVVPRD